MTAPFDTLLGLAGEARDDAATQLGRLRSAHSQSSRQLEALLDYRNEYQERFDAAMADGLSMASVHNYRHFIASLDNAIAEQRRVLAASQDRVSHGRHHWQQQQRRVQSFDVLGRRQNDAARRAEARREQHQTDEYASRAQSALGGL